MAKTTTGETKPPKAPARRRNDKVTAAAPAEGSSRGGEEGVKVRKAPGRRRSDTLTPGTPMAEAADRGSAAPQSPATSPMASSVSLSRDDVQRRAFELYLGRGRKDGRDVEDWLEAERQLREGR